MNKEDHMMSLDKLEEFKQLMLKQLESHYEEKQPLKQVPIEEVWKITVDNIEERLHKLRILGPEVMEKQCIHIANYCFFLWQKLEELHK